MIKDGKAIFYELLLIAEENGSLAIKLRTFERVGNDRVKIYLAIENKKDGSVREEIFEYPRAQP